MKELSLIEKLFSITNEENYKVIRLFGCKYKIDRRPAFKKKYGELPLENKIVFSNFHGNGYGCNPKYIAQQILKENLPYELVWLVKEPENLRSQFPSEIRLVEYTSKEAMKELATAKVWVNNQRLLYHLKKGLTKRPQQCYIQTWHGSLGIKKLDADVSNFNTPEKIAWINMSKYDSYITDYLLSNSSFEDNILPGALWFENNLIKSGHPRNDIFFFDKQQTDDIRNKVYSELGIDLSKKVILYVPSFRDDHSTEAYNIEYKNLVETLGKRFGNEWVVAIRLHPRAKSCAEEIIPQANYIFDATNYPDIQELLSAADAVITDYSSCVFDFMLSQKPAFIYAPDMESYDTERGFYYPLAATPFPIAVNNTQLNENILNFDYDKYVQRVKDFTKEKGCIEDGKASQRVVELIKSKMAG